MCDSAPAKRRKSLPILGLAVFLILALALGALWYTVRPRPEAGEKNITVDVVHSDGREQQFSYITEEAYLGPLLVEEGLISGSESAYGLYVETVDGETADYDRDGSWWRLQCNGEDAQTGADTTPLRDGDIFCWTYTVL